MTESAHTLRSIAANAGGPENLAALLRTAEGRHHAIATLQPITDGQFQVRQRRGREDYERLIKAPKPRAPPGSADASGAPDSRARAVSGSGSRRVA